MSNFMGLIFALALIGVQPASGEVRSVGLADLMRERAQAISQSLLPELRARAVYAFNADEKERWRYFPSPKGSRFPEHTGLKVGDLNADQEILVLDLLALALEPSGQQLVRAARAADSDPDVDRNPLHKLFFKYGRENYFISFFGNPDDREWMWRFEGHHVSVNVSIKDGKIASATPSFLGAYPSSYHLDNEPVEIHQGTIQALKALTSSLSADQLNSAKGTLREAPEDLLYTPSVDGTPRLPSGNLPAGLPTTQMTQSQQQMLASLVLAYWSHCHPELAAPSLARIKDAGLEKVEFVYVGAQNANGLFYFRVQGPTFIFEFGQGDRSENHYHVAWQDR